MLLSQILNRVTWLVDWFIPPVIAVDREQTKQARMFLYSHIFGPFIGNTVPLALYLFDPHPGYRIWVLSASITGFWIFPFVLRWIGHYNLLAILSVQNLIFCILWSCYFYGGVTSPTLPWVLTIPLLSFFYVGPSPSMRVAVLTQFALSLAIFYFTYQNSVHAPLEMSMSAVQGLGLVSTVAASLYVTMMALFYANALASQVELEFEMKEHQIAFNQLRVATEAAKRAGNAKSEFVANMSHELRTPLNAVIGYSEILLEDAEDENDNSAVSDLRKIHGAGHYLLKLVNEILDLSKIEAGKMEVFCEVVDCHQLIEAMFTTMSADARRHGDRLILRKTGPLGLVYTDAGKLQQILAQLLDNAIKFTRGGEITVDVGRRESAGGDEIVIEVRDTGAGIARERFPVLFEQFNLEGDTSASKYGGTGLGLSLCKKLCEILQGGIAVESEVGRGSVFTVRIPAMAGDAMTVEDEADLAFEPPASSRANPSARREYSRIAKVA